MRRILVLRGGALGDFLVTLPALALLRQHWPAAEIDLIGNASAASLAVSRGLITKAYSQHEARWRALYEDAALPPPLATFLGDYDLVINYWPDPDEVLRRHFPRHSSQRFLCEASHPTRAPAAAHYCAPLETLGLRTADYHFLLRSRETAARDSNAPILIHPGSGSPRKNWPLERWLEVANTLTPPVAFILGEAEQARWQAMFPVGAPFRPIDSPPLEELAVHLSRCRLFLGHDSGVSHLAAACDAPGILLFGPTDPTLWAPPSPRIRVIRRSADLKAIAVPDVLGEITSLLAAPA